MTLKKLSSKRIWAVAKTQLYQMRMLWVLAGLILLICPTVLTLGEFVNGYWNQYEIDAVKDYVAGYVSFVGFPVMFVLGIGIAVAQFGYLHRKQKLDYFHALPVRREEHFFGRVIASGIALATAGAVIFLGQVFAVGVTLGLKAPSVVSYMLGICMGLIVPSFLAYLFTTLIIVLTATLWETVFSLLAISALGPAVYLFAYALITCSIPVHNNTMHVDWALFLSPFAYGVNFVVELNKAEWTTHTTVTWVIVLLQMAVCFVLAFWFFCRRKSEQAESGGATRFKTVVRFAAAVCASMTLSLALLWAVDQYAAYLFGSVLGLALAWVVMELLYTRSLRGAMKCLAPNLLGYAVFVVINLLVAFGWIGVPEIPDLADINAVSVWYGRHYSDDEISESEYFHGNYEEVYTDAETHRSIDMGTFDAQLVGDGRALAELLLENQKDLYFPYLPKGWGESGRENPAETYDYRDVMVQMITDDGNVLLKYDDFAQNGNMVELFDRAKAIATTETYKMSNPSLAVMENLAYVLYTDYEKNIINEQYVLKNIEDGEDFIRRLREAYLEDMYSANVSRNAYYDEKLGIEYSAAEIAALEDSAAISMHDEYSLYFDASQPVVLQGGIVDGAYSGAGMKCWLLPQFTPSYDGDLPDAEETAKMGNAMYFYREDFPKTCAVLDELRAAANK